MFDEILKSSSPELAEARKILERIYSRQLYKFLGQTKAKRLPEEGAPQKKKIRNDERYIDVTKVFTTSLCTCTGLHFCLMWTKTQPIPVTPRIEFRGCDSIVHKIIGSNVTCHTTNAMSTQKIFPLHFLFSSG